eukprot:g945.t1
MTEMSSEHRVYPPSIPPAPTRGGLEPQTFVCTRESEIFQLSANGELMVHTLQHSSSSSNSKVSAAPRVLHCSGSVAPGKDAIHLCLNVSETCLALIGRTSAKVVFIRDRGAPQDALATETVAKLENIGDLFIDELDDTVHILQAAWHPYSDAHLVILFSNNQLCLFDVECGDLCRPDQIFDVQPDSDVENAISFFFGASGSGSDGGGGWDLFTAYIMSSNGDIYTLCPIMCGQNAAGVVCRDLFQLTTHLLEEELKKPSSVSSTNTIAAEHYEEENDNFMDERYVQELRLRLNWLQKVVQSRDLAKERLEENRFLTDGIESESLIVQNDTSIIPAATIASMWRYPATLRGPYMIEGRNDLSPPGTASRLLVIPLCGTLQSSSSSSEKGKKKETIYIETCQRLLIRSFDSGQLDVLILTEPIAPFWGNELHFSSLQREENFPCPQPPLVMMESLDLLLNSCNATEDSMKDISKNITLVRDPSAQSKVFVFHRASIYTVDLLSFEKILMISANLYESAEDEKWKKEVFSDCSNFSEKKKPCSNSLTKEDNDEGGGKLEKSVVQLLYTIDEEKKNMNPIFKQHVTKKIYSLIGSDLVRNPATNGRLFVVTRNTSGALLGLSHYNVALFDENNEKIENVVIRKENKINRNENLLVSQEKVNDAEKNAENSALFTKSNKNVTLEDLENVFDKYQKLGSELFQLDQAVKQLHSDSINALEASATQLSQVQQDVLEAMETQAAMDEGVKDVVLFADNLEQRSQVLLQKIRRMQKRPSKAEQKFASEIAVSMGQVQQQMKPELEVLRKKVSEILKRKHIAPLVGSGAKLSEEREESVFNILTETAEILAQCKKKIDLLQNK